MMVRITPRLDYRTRRRVSYDVGPFLGMRDSVDPSAIDRRYARYLQNVMPENGIVGSAQVGRPGTVARGLTPVGGAQGIFQFNAPASGTARTVVFATGRMFVYDWAGDSWSEPVTAANFTTAGVTISTTARIFSAMFGEEMVVTDGTNRPWMWDGGTGAGSVTPLTNAPAQTYGPPVVYYAKLFFIKRGATSFDRREIVWSEEADPTIGYEAGGFNNAWDLRQTDEDPLHALYATNSGLYYFRRRSIGLIVGAVNDEFQTSGVHEAISESVGCPYPSTVIGTDTHIWFKDEYGRPHTLRIGGDVEPVWEGFANTIRDAGDAYSASVDTWPMALHYPDLDLVLFSFDMSGSTTTKLLVYSASRRIPLAVWTVPSTSQPGFKVAGRVEDTAQAQHIMLALVETGGTAIATFGRSQTQDAYELSIRAITKIVEPAEIGADQSIDQFFHRADLTFRGSVTTVDIESVTPAHTAASVGTLAVAAPAGGPTDNVKESIGLGELGRWLRLRIIHDPGGTPLNEAFGFERVRVEAVVGSTAPGVN